MNAGQIDFKAAQKLLLQKKSQYKGSKSGFAGLKIAKLRNEAGAEMKIRFLPPRENERTPGKEVQKHFNTTSDQYEAIHGSPTCLKTYGKECPICKVLDQYRDRFKGSKWFADFSGSAFYTNVIVRGSDEYPENVVHLLQTPPYTGIWLLECLCDDEIGDITDIKNGADVILRREKKDGKISRTISRKATPLHKDEKIVEEILNNLYDCNLIWQYPDDEYLNALDEIAQDLQEIIENRLIGLKKNDDEGARVREVSEAKEARKSSRNDRPECFGEYIEDSRKCRRCDSSEGCERVANES